MFYRRTSALAESILQGLHSSYSPQFRYKNPEGVNLQSKTTAALQSKTYDVVIVGGGHNGLVAAGYLAAAGLEVAVIEKRDRLGGPGALREWLPGYHAPVTNSPGSLEPKVIADLDLMRFGLTFVRPDPTLVAPLSGGRLFLARRDPSLTAANLDRLAPGEGERYKALFAYLEQFANRLGISLWEAPPTLKQLVRNLDSLEDQEAFSRIFFGTARSLCDLFLESPEAKAIVATLATSSGPTAPSTPGQMLNLMMRPLSLAGSAAVDGYDPRRHTLRGSTGLPVGGMDAVIRAMADSARSRGVDIYTETAVAQVTAGYDGVTGVVTNDGLHIPAKTVISAMGLRQTATKLMKHDSEWDGVRAKLPSAWYAGGSCKVVLAIDGVPQWAWNEAGVSNDELASAQFRVAPSLDYMEQANADIVRGMVPRQPVIWGLVPSMTSPGFAPEGKHIMSINSSVPRTIEGDDWRRAGQEMINNCIQVMSEWIPSLNERVIDARCITPPEFDSEYDLEDAGLAYGAMLPDRMFWMRPLPGLHDYRTPTRGLYLSGTGTWPGNFVSGIPGHNTAMAVMDDLRVGRPSNIEQEINA